MSGQRGPWDGGGLDIWRIVLAFALALVAYVITGIIAEAIGKGGVPVTIRLAIPAIMSILIFLLLCLYWALVGGPRSHVRKQEEIKDPK